MAAAEAYRDETGRTVVIVDAGGDDVGATALARFAPALAAGPYAMLYVVNAFRNLTQEPADAVAVLREIEAKSHLAATAVVGNSHLQGRDCFGTHSRKCPVCRQWPRMAALPVACITAPPFRPFSGKHGPPGRHSQWLCCERVRQAYVETKGGHSR